MVFFGKGHSGIPYGTDPVNPEIPVFHPGMAPGDHMPAERIEDKADRLNGSFGAAVGVLFLVIDLQL